MEKRRNTKPSPRVLIRVIKLASLLLVFLIVSVSLSNYFENRKRRVAKNFLTENIGGSLGKRIKNDIGNFYSKNGRYPENLDETMTSALEDLKKTCLGGNCLEVNYYSRNDGADYFLSFSFRDMFYGFPCDENFSVVDRSVVDNSGQASRGESFCVSDDWYCYNNLICL